MKQEEFKNKVLEWLEKEKIDISKNRVRVYKYRGEWEVRIYNAPIEMPNSKRSFREDKELTKEMNDGRKHGYSEYFTTKLSLYTYINESILKDKEEREFTLEILKNEIR